MDQANGAAVDFFRRLLFSTLFIICPSPTLAQFNDGSGDPFGDEAGRPDSLGGFAACCTAGVHQELSYGMTRMVMTQIAWQPSTIRFDQLELPEEAGSMLRDLEYLLNRRRVGQTERPDFCPGVFDVLRFSS